MNLRVTYVSPSVTTLLGYKVEEMLSKSIADILTPESLELVNRSFVEALELEEAVGKDGYEAPPLEVEVFHNDGSKIWVEVSRVFLRDKEDKPIGVLMIVRDITKRKQVEEAVQRSERRHRELIENNPEGISIVDFNQKIIFVNQAFATIFGYEVDELQGMDALNLVSQRDREKVLAWTSQRRKGLTSAYQVETIRKDGERRIVRVSAVPWRNDEGDIAGSISVVIDVTKRVYAESKLATSLRDLELYASLLRHDLGNDIQVILTQAELQSSIPTSDSQIISACEIARHAAERMKQLLEMLEAPEVKLTDDIVSLLESRATQAEKTHNGLKVRIHANSKPANLKVRCGRLLPALFDNLLRNSHQHAGPNVEVHITVQRDDDVIQVDVIDNGPGIPDTIRSNLFQKGISTTGGGLGLYLCRRIARAYEGEIVLLEKEECPSGTGFRITLPAA